LSLSFRVPQTKKVADGVVTSSGVGKASIYHALVVIFLEFFAWGLLTSPMITGETDLKKKVIPVILS
jgi:hypothetical protein